MKKLFTLFVGINNYQGRFNTLRGCVNDVNSLEEIVQKQYSNSFDIHHRKLTDFDATYKNIVDGFRDHLRKAGPDDTVWFHYSGHGTEEPTADEFLSLEPNGKDQNLICFDTWPDYAPYLADKELAVLINEVATQTETGQAKESPHIVISLDCCHSGSGTRDASEDLILPRAAEPLGNKRDINTYLDGYYAKQRDLDVPSSQHVLLAACESVQLAGDSSGGGVFTAGLVKALEKSKGEINYADLFMLTRSTVAAKRKNQTPQFQTIDNFNPYRKFLEGSKFGTPDRYEVIEEGGDWFVKCGAIHGLPTNTSAPLEVEIQDPTDDFKREGTAIIKFVGAQRSKIDIDFDSGLKDIWSSVSPRKDPYVAVFNHFPAAPVFVKLTGEESRTRAFEEKWSTGKNIRIATGDDKPQLEVKSAPTNIVIIDYDIPQEAYTEDPIVHDSNEAILGALEVIAKWKRMSKLRNKNTRSQLQHLCSFELEVVNKNKKTSSFTGEAATIFAGKDDSYDTSKQGGADLVQLLHPYVHIKNAEQVLYFYLFQLENDYSIICHEDEVVFRPEEYPGQTEVKLPLWTNKKRGWGLMPNQNTLNTQFKLIATTEKLDYQQLTQAGLSASRGTTVVIEDDQISDDWWMMDMVVTMTRQDGQVNADQPVILGDGAITIEPHPSFNGKAGISDASGGSRSANGVAPFGLTSRPGFEIVNFNKTRNAVPQDLLEIGGIHPTAAAGLEENPLRIKVDTKLEENESMLPIAFDGEHYFIVGDTESEGDKTVANIRTIPEGEQATERGIFQSLKLAFVKIGLKKADDINILRRAEVGADGSIEFSNTNMKSKIAVTQKTLLVIHGLLGDTSTILKNMHKQQPAVLKSFDLILTFDYENLTQSLGDTAKALGDLLSAVEISNHPSNELTVLAHGSGGLIARHYIEKLGGKDVVKHLIMVGTPNNGTQFAQVDNFRKYATETLNLALNFVPHLVPYSGILLKGFSKLTSALGSSIGKKIGNQVAGKLGEELGGKIMGKLDEQVDAKLGLSLGLSDQDGGTTPESEAPPAATTADGSDPSLMDTVSKGLSDLTGSLRDMYPTSSFIDDLNSSEDPGIPYTIVAGDVKEFAKSVPGFAGFIAKSKMKIGNLLHGGEHDLFASIGSIQNTEIWSNRTPAPMILPKVDCHHYNYFQVNSPLWNKMLGKEIEPVSSTHSGESGPPAISSQEEREQMVPTAAVTEAKAPTDQNPTKPMMPPSQEQVIAPQSLAAETANSAVMPPTQPKKPPVITSNETNVDPSPGDQPSDQKIDDLIKVVSELSDRISSLEKKLSSGKISFE